MKKLTKYRIICLACLAVCAVCLSIGISSLVSDEPLIKSIGGIIPLMIIGALCGFASFFLLFFTFLIPALTKVGTAVQEDTLANNKSGLTNIANISAEISENAVTTLARAGANGIRGSEMIYCKYCGKQIDADSVFCKHCGKAQKTETSDILEEH